MLILGIDPGLQRTGFGLVQADGPRLAYVASGTISTLEAPRGDLPLLWHHRMFWLCSAPLRQRAERFVTGRRARVCRGSRSRRSTGFARTLEQPWKTSLKSMSRSSSVATCRS